MSKRKGNLISFSLIGFGILTLISITLIYLSNDHLIAAVDTAKEPAPESQKEPLSDKDKEAIMKVLKDLAKEIEEKGIEKVPLPFFKDEEAVKKLMVVKVEPKEDIKTMLKLPKEPRVEDGRIFADVYVLTNTPIGVVRGWTLEFKKKDNKWEISDGVVDFEFKDFYRIDKIQFKNYDIKSLIIEQDSFTLTVKDGNLIPGFVDDKAVVAVILGKGTAEFFPPNDTERDQLEKYTKEKTFKEKFHRAILTFHPDEFKNLISNAEVKENRNKIKEEEAKKVFNERLDQINEVFNIKFKAAPDAKDFWLRFFEEKKQFWADFDTGSNKFSWVTYLYFPDDPFFFEEVVFGRFIKRELTEFMKMEIWCLFDKKEERERWSREQRERQDKDRIDIDHLKGEITVESNHYFKCNMKMDLHSLRDNLSYVPFYLDDRLKMTRIALPSGKELYSFKIGGERQVFLPKNLNNNETLTLNMEYEGDILWQFEGDLFFVYHSWVPEHGYLKPYTTDFTIKVFKPMVAVSVGNLVEEKEEDNYNVYHWVETKPIMFAGFTMAKYVKRIFTSEKVPGVELQGYVTQEPYRFYWELPDIKDASWQGWTQDSQVQEWIRRYAGDIIEIDFHLALKKYLEETESILNLYDKLFGPYPYKKLAITQLPYEAGFGQGLPSMLILAGFSFLSPADLARFEFWDPAFTSGFIAHEVSHQWWGHKVPWYSYHDQWLSEAFAQMSSAIYLQSRRGHKEYADTIAWWDHLGKKYDKEGPIWLGYFRLGYEAYSYLTYFKGPYILHMLRMMFGDEAFQKILSNFVSACQRPDGTSIPATSLDFKKVCELTLGKENLRNICNEEDLEWFFNQWLFDKGYPIYDFAYSISGNTVKVRITQTQEGRIFKTIAPIFFYFEDGSREVRRIINQDKVQELEFQFDKRVSKVTFDEFINLYREVKYSKL